MKKRLSNKQKKKIAKDTWNLDRSFYEWLYPRLKCYLKRAGKVLDLDYYKVEYNGKTYTQRECIERMIKILDNYFLSSKVFHFSDDYHETIEMEGELLGLWAKVCPMMWW